jgi:hypothetical protein
MEIIAPQFLFGKRSYTRDICIIRDWCDWNDYPANARLIAAAPDLLACLQKIALLPHEHSDQGCADMCARCIADFGIAKAEGRFAAQGDTPRVEVSGEGEKR